MASFFITQTTDMPPKTTNCTVCLIIDLYLRFIYHSGPYWFVCISAEVWLLYVPEECLISRLHIILGYMALSKINNTSLSHMVWYLGLYSRTQMTMAIGNWFRGFVMEGTVTFDEWYVKFYVHNRHSGIEETWLVSWTFWVTSVSRWRHQMEIFSRYWPFVRGIHRSPVNSHLKGQWRGALLFFLWSAPE